MGKDKTYEVVMPTDRWSVRAISPVDIRDGIEGKAVVVHPGWGKDVTGHIPLLHELVAAGYTPIGVDTRYGYSDRQNIDTGRVRLLSQAYSAGDSNPYFKDADKEANRRRLRRPTNLLTMLDRLQVGTRSYVGHSEGGRIVTLTALASLDQTDRVVVVNGVGTGDSSGGLANLARANMNQLRNVASSERSLREVAASAVGSTAYALSHPRRTYREKIEIENTDLWPSLEQLVHQEVPVTVLHATDDDLVSFTDSRDQAVLVPKLDFLATTGGHSNIYESAVRQLIIAALIAA